MTLLHIFKGVKIPNSPMTSVQSVANVVKKHTRGDCLVLQLDKKHMFYMIRQEYQCPISFSVSSMCDLRLINYTFCWLQAVVMRLWQQSYRYAVSQKKTCHIVVFLNLFIYNFCAFKAGMNTRQRI